MGWESTSLFLHSRTGLSERRLAIFDFLQTESEVINLYPNPSILSTEEDKADGI